MAHRSAFPGMYRASQSMRARSVPHSTNRTPEISGSRLKWYARIPRAAANCVLPLISPLGASAQSFAPIPRSANTATARATFKAMENATSSDLDARFGRLVIGGKGQGCDVMVYEAETGKRLYKAKPPPQNWLGYRAPPWVSATCFASTSECVRFFVGTGEHRFRHYDTREAKRAVLDLDVGKTVITSVASSLDGSEAYVANARGAFEIIDLRAGKSRGKFRGNSGSIRQISVHPNGAHVACAGLDQYVRVYDVKTRKCVTSAYAKQPLTSIVFDAHTPEFEAQNVKKSKKSKKRVDEDLVVDYDVSAKKKKKKKSAERLAAEEENAFAKKKKKKKKTTKKSVRYDDDE